MDMKASPTWMHSLARRRHRGWRAAVAAAGVSLGIASIGPAGVAKAAVMASGGQRYYLDCGSGNDAGAGTSAQTAWRTLARLGAVTFVPGDSILLRRGTTCGGVLAPQGSGIAGNPIVISAYGSGARPAIAGNGARAALFLHNVQGYEVRHLDISDTTTPDGTARTGIYVLLDDYGIGSHYVISDVNVHDVTGRDGLDSSNENSGGILLKAGGSSVPTGFDGIEVSGSTVSGVDAIGIGTQSQWNQRPLYPAGAGTFVPMTHVHIFGNRLTNLGGDGILVQNGVDPVIEYNVVDGFGLRATQSHAAVLTYNSDHPVMQFNDVSHGASSPPSFAFSVDPGNSDEVYQYNYSHDNGGPFMLFCAVAGTFTDGATIRYNLSVNDHDVVLGSFIIPVIANGCDVPQTNVRFYNNVIYSPTAALLIGSQIDTVIAFSNNIFAGRPAGSTIIDPAGVYDHNLYRDVGPVPPSDTHAVIADPLFLAPGDAAGLAGVLGYLLRCGSPALGAGAAVADNGGRDFYGFPVATGAAPNIGAYQGPCVP